MMIAISRSKVCHEGGNILNPGDYVAVKMVTVIGHGGDFAVYQGLSEWADSAVAHNGDKVSEEVARAIAPYCAHLHYRS